MVEYVKETYKVFNKVKYCYIQRNKKYDNLYTVNAWHVSSTLPKTIKYTGKKELYENSFYCLGKYEQEQ